MLATIFMFEDLPPFVKDLGSSLGCYGLTSPVLTALIFFSFVFFSVCEPLDAIKGLFCWWGAAQDPVFHGPGFVPVGSKSRRWTHLRYPLSASVTSCSFDFF